MDRSQAPWWKGARGEGYVAVQIALFALAVFGPRTRAGWPEWDFPYTLCASIAGALLLVAGGLLAVAGIFKLGANLTAVPYPRDEATLIATGPYRLVRHPIYGGGVLMAFGWALWVHGWLTIGYSIILLVFFDVKACREEQWLQEKFPDYGTYKKRVRKLIPFIY
jgi:protein-S-isoprenylcysteine O-methyltransferase Ste14